MCGIAGFVRRSGAAGGVRDVAAMLRAQRHRGPDGAGIWAWDGRRAAREVAASPALLAVPEGNAECVLGHNWLAVQDTRRAAAQPMSRGALTIVLNGEIYNFPELRRELEAEGERFETRGDTEVLLAMWMRHGEGCLPRLRGMFAFLLYDAGSEELWAVRDGLGIKPLYWARTERGDYFSSEIRALHAAGAVRRRIREGAALAAMAGAAHRFGEFSTFYEGIEEIPGGYLVRLDGQGGTRRERWFRLPPIVGDLTDDSACARLLEAVDESVAVHLRSSRRVSVCLSGGLDSSTIVSLIGRKAAGEPVSAFTINTAADSASEIELAREVASRAGVAHRVCNHQKEIGAREVLEMAVAYEVPNHVVGPINQFLLMREIAQADCTVVIDGSGGDELVSGYSWWFPALLAELRARGRHAAIEKIETARRRNMAFDAATTRKFDEIFYNPRAWLRSFSGDGMFGLDLEAVAELPDFQFYAGHDGSWREFRERAYATDTMHYLLRQADRLSMWFGLESRVPFADATLIGVAARLAPELLIRDGYLKYPLRRMKSGIPESVRWCTRKLGFWKTSDERYPWMREVGRAIVLQSEMTRLLLPRVEEDWDAARFDQQWRAVQVALLAECATREDVAGLLSTADLRLV